MSFSCPHFDINRDTCVRLKADCVPGRKGCVLVGNSKFAVPVQERLAEGDRDKVKAPKPAKARRSRPLSPKA